MGITSQAQKLKGATFEDMSPKKIAFTPDVLKEIRTSQFKSQKDLAQASDLSINMIALIEKNHAAPTEWVLRKLGKALNVIFTCDWTQERAKPVRPDKAR